MATFAYGQVSTKEQTADNHRLEIEPAGYAVDYWYTDTISGKTSASQRPQFAALLAQIRTAKRSSFQSWIDWAVIRKTSGAMVKLLAYRKISVIALQLGKLYRWIWRPLPAR